MTEPQRTPKVYRRDLLLDSQVCGRPRDEALETGPFMSTGAGGAPRPQSVLNSTNIPKRAILAREVVVM